MINGQSIVHTCCQVPGRQVEKESVGLGPVSRITESGESKNLEQNKLLEEL